MIDGPAAGQYLQTPRAPAELSWECGGSAHSYRLLAHFASTYFYRYVR